MVKKGVVVFIKTACALMVPAIVYFRAARFFILKFNHFACDEVRSDKLSNICSHFLCVAEVWVHRQNVPRHCPKKKRPQT